MPAHVTLSGKTHLGKTRVANRGSTWRIRQTRSSVRFSTRPGPWLLLTSVRPEGHLLWVHAENDPDHAISSTAHPT